MNKSNNYNLNEFKELNIIPKNKYYDKRFYNMNNFEDREIIHKNKKALSIVFTNKIFGFSFVTWITEKNNRNKGYSSLALKRLMKRHRLLFAKVQKGNITSYKFALKNGFKKIIKFPDIFNIKGGTLLYWIKIGI